MVNLDWTSIVLGILTLIGGMRMDSRSPEAQARGGES